MTETDFLNRSQRQTPRVSVNCKQNINYLNRNSRILFNQKQDVPRIMFIQLMYTESQ